MPEHPPGVAPESFAAHYPAGLTADLHGAARRAGAVMIALSYAVPVGPHLGTLCPLRRFTGLPCPFCGMTSGVVATTHGHLGAGLAANPAAPVLVVAVLAAWATWAYRRLAGLGTTRPRPRLPARVPMVPLALVLGALWVYELHRFGWL